MKETKISCEVAKSISCLETLALLGFLPIRLNSSNAWFLSPFREENTASFKVDTKINRWFDHGAGKGGNVIDLVCYIKKCNVKEALEFLNTKGLSFSFHQPLSTPSPNQLCITNATHIKHPALIQYVSSRGIKLSIANQYCLQVYYTYKDKEYFAIGLQNNSGGYELRNKLYKSSSSPKDITFISNKKNNLVVCEGMFDLLTLASLYSDLSMKADILVLNSVSHTKKAIPVIQQYELAALFLDRDQSGISASDTILKSTTNSKDMSGFYSSFGDINDWWVNNKTGTKNVYDI